jgi:hypothetical protein
MVLVASYGGLRFGDVAALRRKRVDLLAAGSSSPRA